MEKVTKIKKSLLDQWEEGGIPLKYARFHGSVPPSENKEPVYEMYLEGSTKRQDKKYIADFLTYTMHGVIYRLDDECGIIPLANISYSRCK